MSDQGMSDQAATAENRPLRRTRIGTVARARGNKMLRVEVDNLVKHWKYGKYIRRRTVLHAQDEKGEARRGDRVEIMECRPISKTKQWRLVRVLSRAASV